MPTTVVKRNGRRQPFDSDKLYASIESLVDGDLRTAVDIPRIVTSVENGLPDAISAGDLHDLVARKTADLAFVHPWYDKLAGKIEMEIIKHSTPSTFSDACYILGTGSSPILSPQFMSDLVALKQYLDLVIDNSCVYIYTYSALKALEHTYLLKKDGRLVERPAYLFMRVALHLHRVDVKNVVHTYELLSHHAYMHATPTMANAGTIGGQLSSCYLVSLGKEYSTASLYRTLSEAAEISTSFGGIGINLNSCPGTGAQFGETVSLGLRPVLELFDASLSVNVKGQNRRPAAMTAYIEVWHLDVLTFINIRRNRSNKGGVHHRPLFQAMWICDLFMERVRANGSWSLFSPHLVPLLSDCFGPTFDARFIAYELDASLPRETVRARGVMQAIVQSQIETGGPFVLFKDTINYKSNQSNMGIITHSNLCTEIVQYSSAEETAVCNLASVVLPFYIRGGEFDFAELHSIVEVITTNLNKVIDRTICPSEQSARGNRRQRAIGIGIQGLADTFIALGYPYHSDQAKSLNKDIMETIYHAAITASVNFSRYHRCYPLYAGSPLSLGLFQFDLWDRPPASSRYDWAALRDQVSRHGVANSLLVALMPTSGTTQITGCTESFEAIQSCIFTRRVLSGEYKSLSPMLVRLLEKGGLWSEALRIRIISEGGSIQGIDEIPDNIKSLFQTAWEIGAKAVIDLAIDRAPYVCQSQSLSLYMENPSPADLVAIHFYTWRAGLKTGLYYLRTRPAAIPLQITVPVPSPQSPVQVATSTPAPSSESSLSSLSSPALSYVQSEPPMPTCDEPGVVANWIGNVTIEPSDQVNESSDTTLGILFNEIVRSTDDFPSYECASVPFAIDSTVTSSDTTFIDILPQCEACGA